MLILHHDWINFICSHRHCLHSPDHILCDRHQEKYKEQDKSMCTIYMVTIIPSAVFHIYVGFATGDTLNYHIY